MYSIPFNKPPYLGSEDKLVLESIRSAKISGDGPFTQKCHQWFEEHLPCRKVLATPSCTAALEMSALLIDIKPGDEVIMPSYTFVSTANAFALRGAKIVFVDVRPDTMNINEDLIEAAITEKTVAIVPVHYAGVACEMDTIMEIADRHGLFVIEDAAQGVKSTYKGRALGTIGHFGAFSFHETKNYSSGGEGGLLLINDERYTQRAEIIREKGTNRSLFFRGMVDKYSWVDIGSSFLPSDIQMACLYAQLIESDRINERRRELWHNYQAAFQNVPHEGIALPTVPEACEHNAHMFYIKLASLDERTRFIEHLKQHEILAVFHYVPLHSSEAGKSCGIFHGKDAFTTPESEKLVRLPLYYNMTNEEQERVIKVVLGFWESNV
ncbi:dTDP-4-amino-4,6-dideoxygalactose transaminase [Vibrio maritimus]|uniref:dTDP-4-amino-4,6-dideoxygalactose transaminase n=1 Tax=Vibrio maritimus TaxID=990268 RepID=UPI0037362F74